jgi:magnesium transporter
MAGNPPPRIVVPSGSSQDTTAPVRPEPSAIQGDQGRDGASASTLRPDPAAAQAATRKKRSHRGGKKKRNRRQSFAAPSDDGSSLPETSQSRAEVLVQSGKRSNSFYRLQRNLSNTSIESETLLDHRYGLSSSLFQTLANGFLVEQRPAVDETSKVLYHGPTEFQSNII